MKYTLINQDELHVQVQFPSEKNVIIENIRDEKKLCFRLRRYKTRLRLSIVSGVHEISVNHSLPGYGYKLDVHTESHRNHPTVKFKLLKSQGPTELACYLEDIVRFHYGYDYDIDSVEVQLSAYSMADKEGFFNDLGDALSKLS